MPTYEYRCSNCGHQLEEFQYISDEPLTKCPACKKNRLKRLISGGGAVVFKGSGFYQTDYRSESYKKAAGSDKPVALAAASTTSTSSTSSPATTATKSKPEPK
ncbi:MAG: zinc ribbon domain-containing protein [Planctomycetaceae bacterium]|jgi:putative FmdB family regulatory protein|nr:zinc ribbon domain-containing protein [Planctomycetaceae bacterium]